MMGPNWKQFEREEDALVKPDVFSVAGLAAWLEQQVAWGRSAERYCFTDNGHCLLAQYFAAHGYADPFVTTGGVSEGDLGPITLFPGAKNPFHSQNPLNDIAVESNTFGEALVHARSLLSTAG